MKTTKKILLTATGALAVGALAGCGLLQNEQEKFNAAVENLSLQENGTITTKMSFDVKTEGAEAVSEALKNTYIETTTSYDEKTKNEEVVLRLVSKLSIDELAKDLDVDLSVGVFVDKETNKAYVDLDTLRDGLLKIVAQGDKFENDALGVSSDEDKEIALESLKEQIDTYLGETFGAKFEDGKKDLYVIDLKELENTDEDANKEAEEQIKTGELVAKYFLTTISEELGSERFEDSNLKVGVSEILDLYVKALDNEKIKEAITDKEVLENVLATKDSAKAYQEGLKDGEAMDLTFDINYKVKSEKFKELDIALLYKMDADNSVAVKIEKDFSDKVKFATKDEVKGANTTDITTQINENGLGLDLQALTQTGIANVFTGEVIGLGGIALIFPYYVNLTSPDSPLNMTQGIAADGDGYSFEEGEELTEEEVEALLEELNQAEEEVLVEDIKEGNSTN